MLRIISWNFRTAFQAVARSSTLGQFILFVIVGCANTAVGLGTIFIMRYGIGTGDLLANSIGYGVGIAVSFTLNRNLTFADRRRIGATLVRFLISAAIAYLINVAILLFCLDTLHAGSAASQLAAMVAYTGAFFFLAKLFAFAERRPAIARAGTPPGTRPVRHSEPNHD